MFEIPSKIEVLNNNMERWLIQRFKPLQIVDSPQTAILHEKSAFLIENDDLTTIGLTRNTMVDAGFMHLATIPIAAIEQGKTGSMVVFEKRHQPFIDVSNLWETLLNETPCDYYKRLAEQFRTVPAAPWYLTPDQIDAMEAARLLALISEPTCDVFITIENQQPSHAAHIWLAEQTKHASIVMMRFWTRQIIRKLAFEFEQEWILPEQFNDGSDPIVAHVHVIKRGLIDTRLRSWNTNSEHHGFIFLCVQNAGTALPSFFHATHHTALMYQDLPRFKELHATRPVHEIKVGGAVPPHDLPLISQLPIVANMLHSVHPLHKLSVILIGSVVLEIVGHTVGMDADMIAWNPLGYNDVSALKYQAVEGDIDLALWNGQEYVNTDAYVSDWYNKEWPSLFGASSMEEVIYNPRYHLYWRGMKMMSLAGTVARLRQRARPAAMADLYSLKHKFGLPIQLPICLPEKVIVGGETRYYTDKKTLDRTYQTTLRNLKIWQNMNVSLTEIREAFPPCQKGSGGYTLKKQRRNLKSTRKLTRTIE